ncbi:hypothetical protein DRE_00801 [Drechslerella stenobrocha 248]|uniref:Aminoglycoside phosphotransferase domain-containing protein n=1 Tax=Drechslerella stenobrocha 248 TaxID=1043628 RepID=W7HYY4_9PEZI|nr:hypothetical protein DRE_00801 [Drechslerella stenobrocha 248]
MDILQQIPTRDSLLLLSKHQIRQFFVKHPQLAVSVCHKYAAALIGEEVAPTIAQGETSYTVKGKTKVVQFRDVRSPLDVRLVAEAQKTYGRLVPSCKRIDRVCDVEVYLMDAVPGDPFSVVQRDLFAPDKTSHLAVTVQHFAEFMASAWLDGMNAPRQCDIAKLREGHQERLAKLARALPQRLQAELRQVCDRLADLFAPDYPQVLNHIELMEMNMHVDARNGEICGVVDWAGATTGPFGLSFCGLETLLGVLTADNFIFLPQETRLRALFWQRFYTITCITSTRQRGAVHLARRVGLFEMYGFNSGDPAREGDFSLIILEATLAVQSPI